MDKKKERYRYLITKPFTHLAEYFSNGDKGHKNPHMTLLRDYCIKVNYYYNQITDEQLDEIDKNILQAFADFFKEVPDAKHVSQNLEIFNIYAFNDPKDYWKLGNVIFNLKLGISMGTTRYQGTVESNSDLYVDSANSIPTLKHELIHALMNYATKSNCTDIPVFMCEGIAEYFAVEPSLLKLTHEECANPTYEKLKKLGDEFLGKLLCYRLGPAIISYLQKNHPGFLNQYLTYFRERKLQQAKEFLESALSQSEETEKWLYQYVQEQQEINQKDEIYSTIVQQMAGHEESDTATSSSPLATGRPQNSEITAALLIKES